MVSGQNSLVSLSQCSMLCTGITCCFLANIMPISNDACWAVGKFSHILSNAGEKTLSYSHCNITISCKQEKQDVAWCLNIYWTMHASYLQCAGCVCVWGGGCMGGGGATPCCKVLCLHSDFWGEHREQYGTPFAPVCWLFPSQHFKCL